MRELARWLVKTLIMLTNMLDMWIKVPETTPVKRLVKIQSWLIIMLGTWTKAHGRTPAKRHVEDRLLRLALGDHGKDRLWLTTMPSMLTKGSMKEPGPLYKKLDMRPCTESKLKGPRGPEWEESLWIYLR